MKQPEFWFREPGLAAGLLFPFSLVWSRAARMRARRPPSGSVDVPVICIGNLSVGGSGKSPLTIALAQRLSAQGSLPHLVSRGYRGKADGPLLVDGMKHDAALVGDEPLLLAQFAPTWVARDRLEGARQAVSAGACAVLLDDGHQDPTLARDLSILVVDAVRGFGNRRTVPSGPLREDPREGLARCQVLVVVGSPKQVSEFIDRNCECARIPHVGAQLSPVVGGAEWQGMRVLAFAGIGYPEKFFLTLRSLGAEIVKEVSLSDHQRFSERLLMRLESDAKSRQAQLVTTEKDAVRLSNRWRKRVLTVPVRMELRDWLVIDQRLQSLGLLDHV